MMPPSKPLAFTKLLWRWAAMAPTLVVVFEETDTYWLGRRLTGTMADLEMPIERFYKTEWALDIDGHSGKYQVVT